MPQVSDPTLGTSEPGRYWTTTNLGEAAPDVMSPLDISIWGETAERGWQYSMKAFGVLPSKQQASKNTNDWGLTIFYGRIALNVDAVRAIVVTLPGVSGDDFERDLGGSVRPDAPPVKGKKSRIPVIMVKAPLTLVRQSKVMHAHYGDVRTWWEREVLDNGATAPAIDRLVAGRARFEKVFGDHCAWRFVFSGAQSAITDAAKKAGDPLLGTRLMSGVGEVFETRMADDLWRVAHGQLEEAEFIRLWGYHGPNEGNVDARVWREDPTPVRALAKSYAERTDTERPKDRETRSVALGAEAERALLAATSAAKRPAMRWLMRRSRNIVRTLQVGKAAYLMCIDGVRRAARDFGAEQVAAGTLAEVDDVFYLQLEECQELAAGRLPNAREIVTARRGYRAAHRQVELPVFFNGMPEAIRREAPATGDRGAVEFSGAASGGAQVEGRARVLLDVNDAISLDDGDILVCRFTDPSWAPLMSLAEALVIDVGGSASHGAVVARELGIPYVIGTERGTSLLRDGDRILVDGEKNLVRVLP
ncbi:PEP-utilizing enzyme [Sporichthya sp.]|uniref:PEP-utilizing enzyme n=1 Tax=Sporichthya sp. TaxID=65475 RepID=UPI00185D6C30|nr:PEP-utilizing enzyme [Sporichthya sp.]MBA3743749.1 phosphoenolpyruvate-utilizing protein [Sporichthya sp.]